MVALPEEPIFMANAPATVVDWQFHADPDHGAAPLVDEELAVGSEASIPPPEDCARGQSPERGPAPRASEAVCQDAHPGGSPRGRAAH